MNIKRIAKDFPIVCVGGSAGGLDAYTHLLRHLPADMGVAIVIVNHLRTQATRLHEILPNYTGMPVELITENLLIEPNHVFIIPAQLDLHVFEGEFRLKPLSKPRGWPDVITVFLRSLTKNWDGKLIAVMLRILGALQTIAALTASPGRRRALRDQALWITELAERTLESAHDREMIDKRLASMREALEGEGKIEKFQVKFLKNHGRIKKVLVE